MVGPARQRLWLLGKALESLPLDEALRLAQQAEKFLSGGEPHKLDPIELTQVLRPPAPELAPVPPVTGADDDGAASFQAKSTPDPAAIPAEPLIAEIAPADAADQQDEAASELDDLAVLAGAEDVVRYLRQRDNIVVPADDGNYLVNARFRETVEQLVERANRMRARQKLARFVLLPGTILIHPRRSGPR